MLFSKIVFLFLFQWFYYDLSSISFLGFNLVRICWASWTCRLCLMPKLRHYQSLFLQTPFQSTLFILCFQDPNGKNIRSSVIVPQVLEDLCLFLFLFFQSIFFQLFRLGNSCSIFDFDNSLLCPLHSTIEHNHWVFWGF